MSLTHVRLKLSSRANYRARVRRYIAPKRIRLDYFDYDRQLDFILQELVRQKLYLELNLKGLREAINEPTPGIRTSSSFSK
jgi:hypothetical protein